jgi:hypothetical protein
MCRNITRLREGTEVFEPAAMEAAARQYVRKVSGFQKPSQANQEAFESAVRSVASATQTLMESLQIRG